MSTELPDEVRMTKTMMVLLELIGATLVGIGSYQLVSGEAIAFSLLMVTYGVGIVFRTIVVYFGERVAYGVAMINLSVMEILTILVTFTWDGDLLMKVWCIVYTGFATWLTLSCEADIVDHP
jgi:hypothetical protein